jgi:hypothetical protein
MDLMTDATPDPTAGIDNPWSRRRQGLARRVASRMLGVPEMHARIVRLENEVAELRRLNLRLAELTDVVQELLVPLSARDQDRVDEVLERYTRELGS